MQFRHAALISLLLLIQIAVSPSVKGQGVVLTVAQDGKLHKHGNPYRGIGVNYFDAFNRTLFNANDRSYLRGFDELGKHQIPFARVMLTGYWPSQLRLYLDNPAEYFTRMDDVIAAASRNNIGIVASLNWNPSTIPDLVGEPISSWGNKYSKTVAFMRKYTRDVVKRYKNNEAIWMWEFGNEYSLLVDLPLLAARMNRPAVNVSKGTPHSRTDKDDLRYHDLRVAFDAFVEALRMEDSDRIISTGNSLPRPFAYHNSYMRNWALDTKEQFCHILTRDNPVDFNVVSIHVYRKHEGKNYFATGGGNLGEIVFEAKKCALLSRRPLFVGEFGFEFDEVGKNYKNAYIELIGQVLEGGADLSTIWVYDFKYHDKCCSFSYDNENSFVLNLLRDANNGLR